MQDLGSSSFGCLNDLSENAKKCSTGTTLTDYQFGITTLGTNVTIRAVIVDGSNVEFYPLTSGQRRALEPHALLVDGVYFRFADATRPGVSQGFRWTSPGFTWSEGDSVELKVVKRYWTGVDLYGGDMVHQADGYQYMDLDEGVYGQFWVRLTQAPTATVTITIGKLSTFGIDDFDAVDLIDPQTRTFTTSNWQTGQSVTLRAATDGDSDDDRIIIGASVSIASGANANDPYRNPDRVNGFVLNVTDTTSQNSPVNPVPTVESPIGDVAHLQVGTSKSISLSGVFGYDGNGELEIFAGTPDTDIATVSVAQDGSSLTVTGVAAGTATIEVLARDLYGEQAIDEFNVTVEESAPNSAPTVASPIDDATIANQSGTHKVSLAGVFDDADEDALTISAESSKTSVATVSVSADQTSLTVSAKKRGTCRFSSCPWMEGPATITVTAKDGNGGSVSDSFTVTVKSAPVVASALPDITGLEIGDTRTPSLSGVFSDADQDAVTVTEVASSDTSKVSITTAMTTAADGTIVITGFTLTAEDSGTATVTVTAQDSDGNSVSDAFDVTVNAQQQKKANSAPTVASAIDDATIVNTSGTHQVTLSSIFSDEDADDTLTIKAKSSKTSVATVAVSSDGSTLTVTAKSRGTATITVTASDGNGGSVEDAFSVKVKAAPTVASAMADISSLLAEDSHDVTLSNVFSDADGDTLTYNASSTDEDVAVAYIFFGNLTLFAIKPGTVTITLTAEDSDGNSVSDAFDVTVTELQEQVQEKEKQPQQQQQEQPTPDLPGPVVSLEVTARTEDSVTVTWTAPETGGAPNSYIVHLKPEDGEKGSGKTKKPKATKTQVTFKNLEPGRTYNIWVRAQNQTGKGERVYTTITLP